MKLIPPSTPEEKKDLQRAIICLVLIVVSAFLVYVGKADIGVFVLVFTGVTAYYLGKSSDKGSLIQ